MTETITLYTIKVPYGQDVPVLLSDAFEVKPKSFMRKPAKYDGLPNRLNNQEFVNGMCPIKLTAIEAWDFYINDQIEEKAHHQKKADTAQRRLDWAFAQHRKAELDAR